jgi:hypothetical protein
MMIVHYFPFVIYIIKMKIRVSVESRRYQNLNASEQHQVCRIILPRRQLLILVLVIVTMGSGEVAAAAAAAVLPSGGINARTVPKSLVVCFILINIWIVNIHPHDC